MYSFWLLHWLKWFQSASATSLSIKPDAASCFCRPLSFFPSIMRKLKPIANLPKNWWKNGYYNCSFSYLDECGASWLLSSFTVTTYTILQIWCVKRNALFLFVINSLTNHFHFENVIWIWYRAELFTIWARIMGTWKTTTSEELTGGRWLKSIYHLPFGKKATLLDLHHWDFFLFNLLQNNE